MSQADDDAYYKAFGKFIHWYARVEGESHSLFEWCSGLTQEEARSITTGQRLKDIMSMTKRLAALRKIPTVQKEIDTIFDQISAVSALRDFLVHRGATVFGDKAVSTNIHSARSKADWEYFDVKILEIKDAGLDCARMWTRMRELIDPNPASAWKHGEGARWLAQPWRYKHRPPTFPHRPPSSKGSSARSKKRQPSSSQG